MRPLYACILLAAIGLAGCSSETDSPDFIMVGDIAELMGHMIDPAADVYWAAVGTIVDEDGVHEITPANDEEWELVSNAAFTIAEAGNLLMMEGRRVDRGAWMTFSQQLVTAGEQALEAADARNRDAVFDMGAEVYYICSNCHAAYAIEALRPSDSRVD